MTIFRLQNHYDRKYASSNAEIVPVRIVKNPKNRIEMAAKWAAKGNHGRYLEIGAGGGELALAVSELYDSMVLTEIAEARVVALKSFFMEMKNVQVLKINIEQEKLSMYPDNYFDTVCMIDVIEHMIEPIFVLNEIIRVMKEGGKLIIHTPNIAKWTRRIKLFAGFFPSTASVREGLVQYDRKTPTDIFDEGHLHYFTFRSLSRLGIERIGFKSDEWHGYGTTYLSQICPTIFSDIFIIFYK